MADFLWHHYKLRIECEFVRAVLSDPYKVIRACQERGINSSLDADAGRLPCEKCVRKPWRVKLGWETSAVGRALYVWDVSQGLRFCIDRELALGILLFAASKLIEPKKRKIARWQGHLQKTIRKDGHTDPTEGISRNLNRRAELEDLEGKGRRGLLVRRPYSEARGSAPELTQVRVFG